MKFTNRAFINNLCYKADRTPCRPTVCGPPHMLFMGYPLVGGTRERPLPEPASSHVNCLHLAAGTGENAAYTQPSTALSRLTSGTLCWALSAFRNLLTNG